ncbi:MAG: 2-keto-4-pentenoate hydratase [Amphiplicatus sp.]
MTIDIEGAADLINDVYLGAPPIAPLRDRFQPADIGTAYAIQEANTARWLAEGKKLTGRKIGLTSKAVQQQLGVDQPDYGMLFDTMRVGEGEEIAFASISQPRIEGEIAFVLGRDLDREDITSSELVDAIDYAIAAFEVVGSRIRNWDIKIFDTIADNASSGKYLLGLERKLLKNLDLLECVMEIEHRGRVVSAGDGAACLGSPLNAALWLANKMVETGRPLKCGDTIMSGALGPVVPVSPDGVYDLAISGLGSVRAVFRNDT